VFNKIKEITSKDGVLHFKRWNILSTRFFYIYLHGIYMPDDDKTLVLACFYDSAESKKFRNLIKEFLPDLKKIDFLIKKTPTVDEVLYKFRGLDIEEHILRDIVEFAQGKK